jgi:hypothetical protein
MGSLQPGSGAAEHEVGKVLVVVVVVGVVVEVVVGLQRET